MITKLKSSTKTEVEINGIKIFSGLNFKIALKIKQLSLVIHPFTHTVTRVLHAAVYLASLILKFQVNQHTYTHYMCTSI